MKVLFIKNKQIFLFCLIFAFMLALVLRPDLYMNSAMQGILLWANSVLPALFPFFFLSGILVKLNVMDKLASSLSKLMWFLFRTPGCSGIIYIMSIISGYPVGAKLAAELYKEGALTKNHVVRVNAFASTSGPLFIIGSVGVGMFLDYRCGLIMLIAHYLGALINGLVYRNYGKREEFFAKAKEIPNKTQEILSKTMYDSIISILIVGGYICIFYILCDVLFNLKIFEFLGNIFGYVLTLFGIPSSGGAGIASGILEVTRGCADLAAAKLPLTALTVIGCTLISWGGVSILLQALTFLSECKIKKSFYILQKFTQSLISGTVCLLLCLIFL